MYDLLLFILFVELPRLLQLMTGTVWKVDLWGCLIFRRNQLFSDLGVVFSLSCTQPKKILNKKSDIFIRVLKTPNSHPCLNRWHGRWSLMILSTFLSLFFSCQRANNACRITEILTSLGVPTSIQLTNKNKIGCNWIQILLIFQTPHIFMSTEQGLFLLWIQGSDP